MNSNSERQVSFKDRISELPDDIIYLVLSFLPTTCAVRTTVLSTRWNNIWTFVPNLDFDYRRDFRVSKIFLGARFKTFVDRVLLYRSRTDIRKFRLQTCAGDDDCYFLGQEDGDSAVRVESWIGTALRRNVVELDVFISSSEKSFQFPGSIFRSKTMEIFKVGGGEGCYIDFAPPPTSGCFPNLKSLHVDVFNFTLSMEKIFTYFPVLEDLTIVGNLSYDADYNFKVSAPELKMLKISLQAHKEYNFCIQAPKLESLDFDNVSLSNNSLENVISLAKAKIAFRAISELESFPNFAVALLAEISGVKHLHLTAHCLEARYFPTFCNLKQLELVLRDCNYWEFLVELLDKSLNLEGLLIESRSSQNDEKNSELQWHPPNFVPGCLVSHLRTVCIREYRGRQVEMGEVAKYLLKNGSVLKNMTIYATLPKRTEALNKELRSIQKASMSTCLVKVIKLKRRSPQAKELKVLGSTNCRVWSF